MDVKILVISYEEDREQAALIQWFRIQYPQYEKLLFHIPNGQNVGAKIGARLKRTGLLAGVPDLFLAIPSFDWHGLFIEMKSKPGKLTAKQKEMHKQLIAQRYHVVTAYGWHEGHDIIKEYLAK